jgi:hypothetical protein
MQLSHESLNDAISWDSFTGGSTEPVTEPPKSSRIPDFPRRRLGPLQIGRKRLSRIVYLLGDRITDPRFAYLRKAYENLPPRAKPPQDQPELPSAMKRQREWLATVASDYWPELSRRHVNCGCAAVGFSRCSAKTVTPSLYSPPPPKLRCLHCNSTNNVLPVIGNRWQGLCLSCYADLDSRVGVIHG